MTSIYLQAVVLGIIWIGGVCLIGYIDEKQRKGGEAR
jgi:hypothetical protein